VQAGLAEEIIPDGLTIATIMSNLRASASRPSRD